MDDIGGTVCFTGHRPNKLNGYDPKDNRDLLWRLHKEIVKHIELKDCNTFISGMALGIDIWAAKIVLKLKRDRFPNVKLVCAIPCKNQESRWVKSSQLEWQEICKLADEVIYVSEDEYKPYLMQKRNEWMVDNANYVIAVHDGTNGGTGNCVNYAKNKSKKITIIKP